MTWTALTFTVSQYGAFALVSDVLTQQGFDGIDDMVNAFGENAGNSIKPVEYKPLLIDLNSVMRTRGKQGNYAWAA